MAKHSQGERERLYRTAERKWGAPAQRLVAIEEFGELQSALARLDVGKGSADSVREEIADAYLMLEQLVFQFFPRKKDFHDMVDLKLDSLEKRVTENFVK